MEDDGADFDYEEGDEIEEIPAMAEELQPIVLAAGSGSRMDQLLGSTLIKCLIPVRGYPLIYFPLKSLAEGGYTGKDVLIIVQDKEREEIRRVVDKYSDKLGLKLEFFSVSDDGTEDDFGTCQSLQLAFNARKIQKDVLLISCDTITNANLLNFHRFHYTTGSDISAVFLPNLNSSPSVSTMKLHGPKSKLKPERDIVGISPDEMALVFLASEADFEDSISLPLTTIRKCPHVKLLTNLTDAHIYIIKKTVFELHGSDGSLNKHSSLKGEFLPFLLNSKYSDEAVKSESDTPTPSFSTYAYIDDTKQCIRVNTIPSYSIINKLNDWLHKTFNIGIMPSKDNDTKIGQGVKVVGGSLVGDQCVVGDKTKLTNAILMDDVEVGENSTIDNSIIAAGCRIGTKCVLKECLVGPKYVVPDNSQFTNEYLTAMGDEFF
jgi:NDP-sugar pyrophosphorylase family protein